MCCSLPIDDKKSRLKRPGSSRFCLSESQTTHRNSKETQLCCMEISAHFTVHVATLQYTGVGYMCGDRIE